MKLHEMEQGTPEWHAVRAGRATASRASDILAKARKPGTGMRVNYMAELVAERLTGRSAAKEFYNSHMQRGNTLEEDAVAAYEVRTGQLVFPVGFCEHSDIMAGASPDGIVNDWHQALEAKCPIPAIHLKTFRTGEVPKEYVSQIVHTQWITGVSSSVFISYCPAFDSPMDLVVVPFARDENLVSEHEGAVRSFLVEVDQLLDEVAGLGLALKASLEVPA